MYTTDSLDERTLADALRPYNCDLGEIEITNLLDTDNREMRAIRAVSSISLPSAVKIREKVQEFAAFACVVGSTKIANSRMLTVGRGATLSCLMSRLRRSFRVRIPDTCERS